MKLRERGDKEIKKKKRETEREGSSDSLWLKRYTKTIKSKDRESFKSLKSKSQVDGLVTLVF